MKSISPIRSCIITIGDFVHNFIKYPVDLNSFEYSDAVLTDASYVWVTLMSVFCYDLLSLSEFDYRDEYCHITKLLSGKILFRKRVLC